jgi:quercetin dioxygenase-like cupin family protein
MKSKDGNKKVKVALRKEVTNFIIPNEAPRFIQIVGLETTVLTGVHGEKMMMVLNETLPDHSVPLHSHPHEQVGIVYDGKAKLRIGDEERIVQKGDFYRIPGNVPHGDTCIGNRPFVMLDIFYPVREDFIEKLKMSSNLQGNKEE